MSKRAEELALQMYPVFMWYDNNLYCNVDANLEQRVAYRQGYEQAEKDLALSIDDIEKIHTFLYAIKNNKQGAFTFTRLSDEQYKEVLRRFNAIKEDMK